MEHNILTDWLILTEAIEYISSTQLQRLLARFGSAHAILTAKTNSLKAAGLSEKAIHALTHPNITAIEYALTWNQQPQHHILTLEDSQYPGLLKQIHDPPALLYIEGNLNLLNQTQIAMVGTRSPSPSGRELATKFAFALAQTGLVITSGLAVGIDGVSHQGALNAQGSTIAVLGSGLEHIYPKCHRQLAADIATHGALVSEFPLRMAPHTYHFPRRNRIISGLAFGTLVVEAAVRSGSLITAQLAMEQGREVFAVPGSINNPFSQGCFKLIQQGAKLVAHTQDILDELDIQLPIQHLGVENSGNNPHYTALSAEERQLLTHIDFETTAVDQIVMRSTLDVSQVTSVLLILELHGYIKSEIGGYRRLA